MPPNSTAKNYGQKLTIKKAESPVGILERDAPLVDSPVAIDFEESHPGGSLQDNSPGMIHPEQQAPDVPSNNTGPFSGL